MLENSKVSYLLLLTDWKKRIFLSILWIRKQNELCACSHMHTCLSHGTAISDAQTSLFPHTSSSQWVSVEHPLMETSRGIKFLNHLCWDLISEGVMGCAEKAASVPCISVLKWDITLSVQCLNWMLAKVLSASKKLITKTSNHVRNINSPSWNSNFRQHSCIFYGWVLRKSNLLVQR